MVSTSRRSMCRGSLKETSGRRWIWCQGVQTLFNPSTFQISVQVCFLHSLRCPTESLSLRADAYETTGLDLSRAARLREVVFRCAGLRAEWITKTLHTVEPQNIQRLSSELPRCATVGNTAREAVHLERPNPNSLLVQFWARTGEGREGRER